MRRVARVLGLIAMGGAITGGAAAGGAQTGGPALTAEQTAIVQQLRGLRKLPDADRAKATAALALEIRALPEDEKKVSLAMGLAELSTEGDFGRETLQAVTTTLSQALKETPIAEKDGAPAAPYVEVAELVRYEGMTTTLKAAELEEAQAQLEANDASINRIDFTLTDVHGKTWTLSQLRGKIVVVNFWATWCPPCRKEMPDLDALGEKYGGKGLVILSISDEDKDKVAPFVEKTGYRPVVLLDPGDKVHQEFHVEGIPHTFVFGRDGRLAAQSIDMRTRGQFEKMLAAAGLTL